MTSSARRTSSSTAISFTTTPASSATPVSTSTPATPGWKWAWPGAEKEKSVKYGFFKYHFFSKCHHFWVGAILKQQQTHPKIDDKNVQEMFNWSEVCSLKKYYFWNRDYSNMYFLVLSKNHTVFWDEIEMFVIRLVYVLCYDTYFGMKIYYDF